MTEVVLNQWIIDNLFGEDDIEKATMAFLTDRKVQNVSPGTIHFYKSKLKLFVAYCRLINIYRISAVTPDILRQFIVYLQEKGHNPGGINAVYRTMKTFLIWWENEFEPEGWKNPIRKIRTPKLIIEPLQPVKIDEINQLLATCSEKSLFDVRDRAIIYFLLDTGARGSETCSVNFEDIDLMDGSILIRCGKGGKSRTVFIGKKTRKALRTYLLLRSKQEKISNESALWITKENTRLTYWGLNEILRRRAKEAEITKPGLHDFRRAFALNFLRNGGNVFALQHLMGHADLQVLRRYLAQTSEDLHKEHIKCSPVENSNL